MTRLSTEQVLKEKQTRDPNSISALALTHKVLSDVSCLSEFKNLERLDLSFNNLTSLEGLKSCINLKWLSVVQNKLQRLRGIEGLSKLTVLNAGKNKLRSMDDLKSLVSLRALILNDNEIVCMCKLDQMKDLNTVVLSRNPIHEIGDSLVKVKSITKLSLSNCQLQTIDSSLKSCTELKELRLAHNDIKTLPAELRYNTKLQNLDLGNNLITRSSDLKVLNSLVAQKNLNLQGNPIAEKDKLSNKVKKLLPNLQIFNARPIDRTTKSEKGDRVYVSSFKAANELEVRKEEKRDHIWEKNSEHDVMGQNRNDHLNNVSDLDVEKELKRKRKNPKEKPFKKEVIVHEDDDDTTDDKKIKGKKSGVKQGELDIIDDGETSFAELFSVDNTKNPRYDGKNKIVDEAVRDMNKVDALVTYPAKGKKSKKRGTGPTLQLSPAVEIGMGGQSLWD